MTFGFTLTNIGGSEQADKYITNLVDRFQWLAKNPRLGKCRDDLMLGVLSYRQGKHTILYRTYGYDIEIGRIFGPGMSIEFHFHCTDPFDLKSEG